MGTNQSKIHSGKHHKDGKSYKEPLTQADISAFVPRVRDIMSDPAYRSGVNVDSVIDMLNDIHDVYLGSRKFVRLPQPLDGIAPADSIMFSTSTKTRPESLLRSNADGSTKPLSRRILSHKLSYKPDISPSPSYNSNYAFVDNRDEEVITLDIDDAIEYIKNTKTKADIKAINKETTKTPVMLDSNKAANIINGPPASRVRRVVK